MVRKLSPGCFAALAGTPQRAKATRETPKAHDSNLHGRLLSFVQIHAKRLNFWWFHGYFHSSEAVKTTNFACGWSSEALKLTAFTCWRSSKAVKMAIFARWRSSEALKLIVFACGWSSEAVSRTANMCWHSSGAVKLTNFTCWQPSEALKMIVNMR